MVIITVKMLNFLNIRGVWKLPCVRTEIYDHTIYCKQPTCKKTKKKQKAEQLQSEAGELFLHLSWLVGCFGLNCPLRQYFSLYRAISQREEERKEM